MEEKRRIEPAVLALEVLEFLIIVTVGYLFYLWGGFGGITGKQLIVLVSVLILFLVTGSAWFYLVSAKNLSEEFRKIFTRTIVMMLILSLVIIALSVVYVLVVK